MEEYMYIESSSRMQINFDQTGLYFQQSNPWMV